MLALQGARWGLVLALARALSGAPPGFALPGDAVPRKHAVELTVDPNQASFDGWMRIELDLRRPVDTIWLNARGLSIREASVRVAEESVPVRLVTSGGEFLGLELGAAAGPGAASVSIRYQGRLEERLFNGVFRRRVGGDWYAYTTFTPIEARRAFPCFDEPRFKTPWEISLRVRREHRAFSNARELWSAEEAGGWKLVRFAATAPLPAELVSFAVGPFDVLDGGLAGASTPVRVITARGRSGEGVAAAQATALVLPRLEAYTGIPYPFGKLDHLAVPGGDFSAVENPGLITYRARALLVEPDLATARARSLRSLQAHEMGHQWFGNLVTPWDWREVWLSEGFATWIAGKVMDMEQPAERAHVAAIGARERIMAADASPRARAVRTPVHNREGAAEIYNRFVYDKAAAVLMMLEGWMGEERFREGVRAYLRGHEFGNATSDDLAAALRGASGQDPGPVMRAFLDAGGVPVVTARVECGQGGTQPAQAELRITLTGAAAAPVCWRSSTGVSGCEVAGAAAQAVRVPGCPAWVYPNAGGTGYYRTAWSAGTLASLGVEELSPAERLTLVYDLRAQRPRPAAAVETLRKLAGDPEPEIARAAREALK
jgi:alanyl aminopeptidase